MPFFKSLPQNAGPPNVFKRYPELYGPWSEMSQALMNGPSPLTQGERELMLAFSAGVAGCRFVYVAHTEVAYAWGVEEGLVERLVEKFDTTVIEPRLKALLAFVRKLTLTPSQMAQADADAVFAAGWDERALHDAIAVACVFSFMNRLTLAHGIEAIPERFEQRGRNHVERGYREQYRKALGA